MTTSPTRLVAWAVALALVATAPAEAAVHGPVAKKKRKRKPLTHVDGDAIGTKYGAVQVRVYFRGRRIVEVRALQDPDEVERSRQIDARALPKLRAKVLAKQSAKIDGVSGATYTSAAYKQSVQSALDLA